MWAWVFGLLAQGALATDGPDGLRWGDQGDGTFRNPILPGDFSDPDVIRVGPDYYLITSTFQYAPGMALLHSKDLVNWSYLGHCLPDLTQLGPELNWDKLNRYNRGVYAGSLRHHDGKYWLFFTTLDEGIFMTTAEKPEGPWAPAHRVWDRKGTDDNCPFWDDDGQAYMVFSTPGSQWYTRLVKMSPDGRSVDPASERVIDAHQTSEGNKIYKIGGYYYVFHNQCEFTGPDTRISERVGVFMRAKNIWGPYEKRVVLRGRRVPGFEDEPNQGGLVQTQAGDWWFITHQGSGSPAGRPASLLPVTWRDGWPEIGEQDAQGAGTLVWSGKKPVDGFPAQAPQTSDGFSSAELQPQWEWNHQPRAGKWSLTERPGFLRLHAFPPLVRPAEGPGAKPFPPGDWLNAGNTLTQRLMTTAGGCATVLLDVSGLADGQTAGFGIFSREYGGLAVRQSEGRRRLVRIAPDGGRDGPEWTRDELWLRVELKEPGRAVFSYSEDGRGFNSLGESMPLRWAWYRGARLALFTYNPAGERGWVDVDACDYEFPGPPRRTGGLYSVGRNGSK